MATLMGEILGGVRNDLRSAVYLFSSVLLYDIDCEFHICLSWNSA